MQINLLDVMYGVVLSYGFNFFGSAVLSYQRILFFLSYALILADWIFVHELYSAVEYKNKFLFFFDIIILFFVSRLIATSVLSVDSFLRWIWILFLSYFLWDLFVDKIILPERWFLIKITDCLAFVFFFVVWFLFGLGVIRSEFFVVLLCVGGCIVVLFVWFYAEGRGLRQEKFLRE